MDILYHHRTMGRGAEGIHIASIVNAFEELGHRVTIISPPGVDPLSNIGQAPVDKAEDNTKGINTLWKYISKKAPQVCFEFLELGYNILSILKLRKVITKEHFDFIYERNAYFLFAGAFISRCYGIPLVVEANEVVGIKRARKLIMVRLAQILEKFTFSTAVSVFTVSSYLKKMILTVVNSPEKVYALPNAIDPGKFIKINTRRDEIRSKYGITDEIILGFAGWFDWWDRLDILINMQKEILERGYRNVSTIIIGDGVMSKDLKDMVKQYELENHVFFTGAVPRNEVIDYIDALDIGVFSHSNEFGSPVVLFEMMGLGKPIIAPDLKPMTDVIANGKTGLIFKTLKEDSLLESILKLVENPEELNRIGNNAKEYVFENHSWKGNSLKIIESLKN
jgi:glycosyltransferase involved in cell wall biosynthesis